jgi:hypothetical protein
LDPESDPDPLVRGTDPGIRIRIRTTMLVVDYSNSLCVCAQVLEKYCTAEKRPSLPNSWSYVLEQPGRATEEGAASSRPASPLTSGGAHRHGSPSPLVAAGGGSKHSSSAASLITKFTKVLSQEERAKVSLKRTELTRGPPELVQHYRL